jgi:cobaltochelatase CobS
MADEKKKSEISSDEHGEKVQCKICDGWFHRVDVHLGKAHGMTSEVYLKKHPGAPLHSTAGAAQAEKKAKKEPTGVDKAEPMIFGVAKLYERTDLDSDEFPWVPQHDEDWFGGKEEMEKMNALALAMQDDLNVLIVGPPGVGKSTLVRELAALVNQPVRRFQFDGELRRSELFGNKEIVVDPKTNHAITSYVDGPLIDTAERGHWAIFEEFDSSPSQVTFSLHSLLENPRQYYIAGSKRHVEFNKRFRVIATANTLGYGDESGLYAGTAPMNEALLDRFGIVIRMDYPKRDDEVSILVGRTKIQVEVARLMVDVATKVRELQKSESMMTSMSPRRLINWAHTAKRTGNATLASALTVTNKLPPNDAKTVEGIVQRFFAGK